MWKTTRLKLFRLLMEKSPQTWDIRYKQANEYIKSALSKTLNADLTDNAWLDVKRETSKYYSAIRTKWYKSRRNEEKFLKINQDWLNEEIDISVTTMSSVSPKGGCPEKYFSLSSDRSKRRKVETLRQENKTEKLAYAVQMNLRSEGRLAEADVVNEALFSTPTRASKMKKAWSSAQNVILPYTAEEALSLMIETDLSKHSYQLLRSQAKFRGADLYPAYNDVREVKKQCYPPNEFVTVTDNMVEIKLQSLLDLTVNRILQIQKEVLSTLNEDALQNLCIISKWGCDGSGNHSRYKQSTKDEEFSDADVFLICLVPLQLYCNDNGRKIIVWQNRRPSSTRYCRPVKFRFAKETSSLILCEKEKKDIQVDTLAPTEFTDSDSHVRVNHELCMTMIDGKTCNALTETASAQTCNICEATPSKMNDIDHLLTRKVDSTAYEYGLSTLHAYIRFFE